MVQTSFLGQHRAQMQDGSDIEFFISFEVFWAYDGNHMDLEPGFYWWACQPGCLPDGEPNGPFPTAEGAYLDAIGD